MPSKTPACVLVAGGIKRRGDVTVTASLIGPVPDPSALVPDWWMRGILIARRSSEFRPSGISTQAGHGHGTLIMHICSNHHKRPTPRWRLKMHTHRTSPLFPPARASRAVPFDAAATRIIRMLTAIPADWSMHPHSSHEHRPSVSVCSRSNAASVKSVAAFALGLGRLLRQHEQPIYLRTAAACRGTSSISTPSLSSSPGPKPFDDDSGQRPSLEPWPHWDHPNTLVDHDVEQPFCVSSLAGRGIKSYIANVFARSSWLQWSVQPAAMGTFG